VTVVLLALGGAAAALGTRSAAVLLVAAAVLGARGAELAAISTWTAAAAAAWLLIGRSPRALALPVLGAAGVIAAAAAPNGAVVLGLWSLGTAAVVLDALGAGDKGRRWGLALLASDAVLAAGIIAAAGHGFEGWPTTLRSIGAWTLLASAVMRAPLAAGPTDDSPGGVLVVRTQVVVLLTVALQVGAPGLTGTVVALAAVGFAGASVSSRRATVDGVQELSLIALALAGARAGWGPQGWLWGALAAGTLMHQLRFIRDDGPLGRLAGLLKRNPGIGLPFLPVVLAELEGAFRVRGWVGVVVLFGVLGGLAGRAAVDDSKVSEVGGGSAGDGRLPAPAAGAAVGLAVAAGLWAPLLRLPHPPAGDPVAWPAAWAGGVVVLLALAGSQASLVSSRPAGARMRSTLAPVRRALASAVPLELVDRVARERVIWIGLGLLEAVGIGLWLVGVGRGFL
jgi:hypothetical protein